MRNVALDLGQRMICFCEVSNGKVIARQTVRSIEELEGVLGGWGHLPRLVDTTRVKQLGVGEHRRKTDRIDAEVLARAVEGNLPSRTCCRRLARRCGISSVCVRRSWSRA